ncbi:MAG: FeoB-associated Cys-rich membrane protein [Mailhella sp.]|nr:FeoB-associated Cys-rich membrane protein [Mailhella sp.]
MSDIIVIALIAAAVIYAIKQIRAKNTCSYCDKCSKNSNCKK